MLSFLQLKIWRLLKGTWKWYVLWFAHNKFIIGVSGVVLNDRNEVLLLRHRYWKKGSWGLPSGYAGRGEKLEDTLVREVKEETGYTIKPLDLIRIVSGYKLRLEASYRACFVGGKLKIDPKEIIEARFFPVAKLPSGLLESHREIIRLALSRQ